MLEGRKHHLIKRVCKDTHITKQGGFDAQVSSGWGHVQRRRKPNIKPLQAHFFFFFLIFLLFHFFPFILWKLSLLFFHFQIYSLVSLFFFSCFYSSVFSSNNTNLILHNQPLLLALFIFIIHFEKAKQTDWKEWEFGIKDRKWEKVRSLVEIYLHTKQVIQLEKLFRDCRSFSS